MRARGGRTWCPGSAAGPGGPAVSPRASLGRAPRRAGRDADAARLTAGNDSDLATVGGAYGAGEISRAHLDVAVGVHRRLHASVREQVMPVTDPATGEVRQERCIRVVDEALAEHARGYTVPEFTRIADRIVTDLAPPRPGDTHRRRYLHLSRLPDGSLMGRFACGPAQALTLTTVLAALAGPRPGKAIDADGVEHDLPDERTPAERRMDALAEAIHHNHRTCHCRHTHHRVTGSGPDSDAESTPAGD